jgi:hypothetical protein
VIARHELCDVVACCVHRLLHNKQGIPLIGVGDLVRAAIEGGSDLGVEFR